MTDLSAGVVADKVEAERLRSAGRERARLFDWNAAATATIDVYRQLVE